MNWITRLVSTSEGEAQANARMETPSASAPAAAPAGTPVGFGRLREIAAAAPATEREGRERELGRALGEAGTAPLATDPDVVWVEAVCRVGDKALGLEWLSRIEDETSLACVARHARIAELRLGAAKRIVDTDRLERIAEAMRHRDKRVYRHCVDILRERRRAVARAGRAAQLAGALRELLETRPLSAARLAEIEKELKGLAGEGTVSQECLDLASAARERAGDDARALRDLGTDAAAAVALCAEIAVTGKPGDGAALRARLEAIAARPARHVAWLADHPTAAALVHSMEKARSLLDALTSDHDAIEACTRFVDSKTGAETDLEVLDAEWRSLPKPRNPAARNALQSRWASLRERLTAARTAASEPPASPVHGMRALPAAKRDALRGLLDRLEQELQAGSLAEAEEIERRLNAQLGNAELSGSLERRLKRGRAQLGQLRDWARWGNEQAREHLIAAAEELLRGEPDVEALGAAVPALREQWKRSDAARPATKSQWERFDAALTKAFQPVLEYRARRAAGEKAAAAAKAALCEEWEARLSGIDWEQADYRAIDVWRNDMGNRWRAAGFAGFREERQLRKRFDRLAKAVDDRLDAVRRGEAGRREELIREAEALCDGPNPGEAIKSVIALQGRWQAGTAGVRLARKDEQALWRRFRSACDAVFSRRAAQRTEQQAERDRHVEAREVLLAAFETALSGNDAGALVRALAEFRRAWGAQREERGRSDRSDARARDLTRRAERRVEALRLETRQRRFELLARCSSLLERLEAAAARGDAALEALVAEARQAWDELPRLAAKEEKSMQARLAAATRMDAARLERGNAERESLLLDLEIALDLPSPGRASQQRRERQLLRLRDRFRGAGAEPRDPEAMVVRWYATAAVPDPEHEPRMAAVVAAIIRTGVQ